MGSLLERFRHDLETALRTRRLVVLAVLYVSAALVTAFAAFLLLRRAHEFVADVLEADPEEVGASLDEALAMATPEIVAALFGSTVDQVDPALAASLPMAMLVIGTLAFVPWLGVLTAFDGLSTPVERRSLCYLTARISPASMAVARGLALAAGLTAVTLVCGALLFGVGTMLLPVPEVGAGVVALLRSVPLLALFITAFTGVVLTASSVVRHPFAALALSGFLVLLVSLLPVFAAVEGGVLAALGHLSFLSPYRWVGGMHAMGWGAWLGSAGALAALSVFWLGVPALVLGRRRL